MEIRYLITRRTDGYYIEETGEFESYLFIHGPFRTEQEAWGFVANHLNAVGEQLARQG